MKEAWDFFVHWKHSTFEEFLAVYLLAAILMFFLCHFCVWMWPLHRVDPCGQRIGAVQTIQVHVTGNCVDKPFQPKGETEQGTVKP